MSEVFVVGDVGGTNTRLVLYEWDISTDKEGNTHSSSQELRLDCRCHLSHPLTGSVALPSGLSAVSCA